MYLKVMKFEVKKGPDLIDQFEQFTKLQAFQGKK
jgi:hypothetical protein